MKIILYPREYNKRGDASLHSVYGITSEGKEVNIKLRIPEDFSNSGGAPSIAEFARIDRKARTPAIASPNNSPDNREGVIIFSNVRFEKKDRARGIDNYIASWASVLSEDGDSPAPEMGVGRIKVKRESLKVRELQNKLSSRNLSDEDREKLIAGINDPINFEYSTIFYEVHAQKRTDTDLKELISNNFSQLFEQKLADGIAYGVYIIICDKEFDPIPNMSTEEIATYNPIHGKIQDIDEFSSRIADRYNSKMNRYGGAILIPCYKINASNSAKSYLSNPEKLKMIYDVYYNEDFYARVNKIVTKKIYLNSGRSYLFDRTFPLEYNRLNLDLLDEKLTPSRVYSSSMELNLGGANISGIRIGIITSDKYRQLMAASSHPKTDTGESDDLVSTSVVEAGNDDGSRLCESHAIPDDAGDSTIDVGSGVEEDLSRFTSPVLDEKPFTIDSGNESNSVEFSESDDVDSDDMATRHSKESQASSPIGEAPYQETPQAVRSDRAMTVDKGTTTKDDLDEEGEEPLAATHDANSSEEEADITPMKPLGGKQKASGLAAFLKKKNGS